MTSNKSKQSRIFSPYRSLGLCSNHVPLCTHYSAKQRETFVITCVGRSFHSYKCSNFGLAWIGDVHKAPISCMASDSFYLYTACEDNITAFFHGGKTAHQFIGHSAKVTRLLPLAGFLLSADITGIVNIWKVSSEELHGEVTLPSSTFELTSLCHPITYTNKVLFGSRQGSLELWNIRSLKQLYRYSGWESSVNILEQSPAVDIIGIGLASGEIVLHNIRKDTSLIRFKHDDGPVASIAFRTDEGFTSLMLSGTQFGHIAVWDLEKQHLVATIRDAHSSVVSGLCCIEGEPLAVSSSPDNSVKLWVFDQTDSSGRLLRERSGHSAPLTCVKFHDGECMRNDPDNTTTILTASLDGTLRSFSPFSDADNRSLGKASFNKKQMRKSKGEKRERYFMPPIVDFASEAARQSDWDCIVCCHENLPFATSWSLDKWTMGSHRFSHEGNRKALNAGVRTMFEHNGVISSVGKSFATTCALSSCGNFVLIGFNTGYVDIFNIQSGIYRGSLTPQPKERPIPAAHSGGPVRGIAVDGINNIAVTADGSCLGKIQFWSFRSRKLLFSLDMGVPVGKIKLCRNNSLLGAALDDFRLLVIDIDLHRVVRTLSPNHCAQITDLTFSPDGRWLISSSMDCTIRTWDLPSACLVDCFLTNKMYPPLGVSMSPVGDFLATIHRDQVGVSLWANRSLYDFVSLHPPLNQSDVQKILAQSENELPSTDSDDVLVETVTGHAEARDSDLVPVNDGLLKLSFEPESKWFSLFNLDLIRERNRPKMPPQKPMNVPFFLPTVPGLDPRLDVPEDVSDKPKVNQAELAALPLSTWTSQLVQVDSVDGDGFLEAFEKLSRLGPSGIDLELRLLTNDEMDGFKLGINFLKCIKVKLESNRDFDLAVVYLARFLKLQGYRISKRPEILEVLSREVAPLVAEKWDRVNSLCKRSMAVISFAKAPLVL